MLRTCAILLVTASALMAAERGLNTEVEKEKAKLTGAWKAVSTEVDGSKLSKKSAEELVITFTATKITAKEDGKNLSSGLYAVDPTKSPKHIDFTPATAKGKEVKLPAIYSLEGDTLKVCYPLLPRKADEAPKRPAKFDAGEGTGNMLIIYKRLKP